MGKGLHILKSSADTSKIRRETYLGRDFLVVPVVALVEGVLHPSNVAEPELALASEFGKIPDSWNGRPVVMNHPQVDGSPVTANSPSMLETLQFGMLFHTSCADNKLRTEAWIDLERVKHLGGEIEETVARCEAGDTVEVSTGLYSNTVPDKGVFEGKKYSGVWREVVPDHLAFLSKGVKGACSIEDGCGTPRINAMNPAATTSSEQPVSVQPTHASGCECEDKAKCGCPSEDKVAPTNMQERLTRFISNTYPDGMQSRDVSVLLRQALTKEHGVYSYLLMFDKDKCTYENYDGQSGNYYTFQVAFTISDNTKVTFTGEPVQVNVLTRIVPVQTSESLKTSAGSPEGSTMEPKTTAPAGTPETPVTPAVAPVTASATPVVEAVTPAPVVETAKPKTMNEYLADAPEGIREVLEDGMRANTEACQAIIAQLKASNRCDYSDDELKGMRLKDLQRLAKLASVPDYAGQQPHRITDNAAGDDKVPDAPLAFPRAA